MRTFFFLLPLLFLVAACGDAKKVRLEGERVSVLSSRLELIPDAFPANFRVKLAAPADVHVWPQHMGNAAHAPGHMEMPEKVSRVWRRSIGSGAGKTSRFLNPPVVARDRIFTLDARGRLLVVSAETGKVFWEISPEIEEESPFPGGLATDGDRLFMTTGGGEVFAFNPETGEETWKVTLGSPIRSAPTVEGGRLFVLTHNNHLYVLEAETGGLAWTHSSIEEPIAILGGAAPAVADGVVIVPYSSGEIYALSAADGRYLWHDALSVSVAGDPYASLVDVDASPVIVDGVVYAVNHNGWLSAFNLKTGGRLWERELSAIQTPWVSGNMLFVVTEDGHLAALHRNTGRLLWVADLNTLLARLEKREKVERTPWVGPVLAGSRLIVASASGQALSFAPGTGEPLSAVELPDGVSVRPIAAAGGLYFLSDDGKLTAYK